MIYKKSPEELATMRRGGRILAGALEQLGDSVKPGVTTMDLDRLFEDILHDAGAQASFKGYRGFPGSICASPNDVIVHGIPGDEIVLDDGDVISIDLGVFYEGFHTDSAWTFPVGEVGPEVARLLDVTQRALEAAIQECRPGQRVGDVGYAVEKVVDPAGFAIVQEFAGHGVGRSLHEEPWVPNYGPPGKREKLTPGMTIAVEPMVNIGKAETKTLADGWTVVTRDGSKSAHFEHTVAITDGGPVVLTAR